MARPTKIVLTSLGLLILAVIFALWIRQTIVSRRLQELVAEAGLTWPPRYRTTVTFDEHNAATLYSQAFELIESTPGLWTGDKADEQPQESRDEAAAYESFLEKFENNETDNLAPELDTLRPWLARNEDGIALLLEAAQIDRCRFPYDFVYDLPDHEAQMRKAARVLQLAALISAADGNAPRAAELSWALLRVGNHLQEDTVVLSNLVRCSIFSMSFATLIDASSIAPVPDHWRKRIDDELLRYSDLDSWADLRKEKLFFLQGIQLFLTGPVDLPDDEATATSVLAEIPQPNPIIRGAAGVWLKPNMVKGLELLAEFEDICRQPYWQVQPRLADWTAAVSNLTGFYSLAGLTLGGMEGYPEQVARAQARAFTARLGLALAAYKQQTGSYPDDLAALTPDFIEEIPLDPFTGKPFIYRTEGEGFVLYSIGPNLTDDDGIYLRDKRNQVQKDDISWRMPR